MSTPSSSESQHLPTINEIKYDKHWGVTLDKAPRPSNAWLIFRRWRGKDMKGDAKEKSKVLGALWSQVSPETRKHFDNLATQVKILHQRRFSGYAYRPRRTTKDERKENTQLYPTKSGRRGTKKFEREESLVAGPSSWLGNGEYQTADQALDSLSTNLPVNDVLISSATSNVALPTSSHFNGNHGMFMGLADPMTQQHETDDQSAFSIEEWLKFDN